MGIKFEKVGFEYSPNSPFAHHALNNVSCEIKKGELTAIVGETGSGKSTLVQHLNALLLPTEGTVNILGYELKSNEKAKGLKALRAKVGLVFQFPEMQLFEEDIYKDVSFGPKNFGFSQKDLDQSVQTALHLVGIEKDLWERSPLNLSGGQKRRVAIAGVLASNPEIIVLDEPTAGLDPQGSNDMMELFQNLKTKHNKTIVMVTHDLEHVLKYADSVIQLRNGSVAYEGSKEGFFDQLSEEEFILPKPLKLKQLLNEKGFNTKDVVGLEAMAQLIKGELE